MPVDTGPNLKVLGPAVTVIDSGKPQSLESAPAGQPMARVLTSSGDFRGELC